MNIKRKLSEVQEKYGDGVAWVRGPILGKGSFGSVYKATLKDPTSQLPAEMAVKSSDISFSSTLRHEKEIMDCLNGSSYIIRCYGDETTVGDNNVAAYNLLLEYGSGGTLSNRIYKTWSRLNEDEVKAYTRSLLMGLYHIHSHGFVHCDLKPENILLVPGKDGFTAKISDFGLSKKGNNKRRKYLKGGCSWNGTPMYLSPESVKGYEQEAASDIWALGCVVIEMFTRNRPWKGAKEEILKRIGEGIELPEIPEWISEDARDFVMLCFEREPESRLSADVLLDHPFLECSCNGYDDRYVVEEFEDYEFRSNRWIPEDWELSSCKNPKVFDYLGAAASPIAAGF